MTVVGVICPKCKDFVTEPMEYSVTIPAFYCKTCKLILEPSVMIGSTIQTTKWNKEG